MITLYSVSYSDMFSWSVYKCDSVCMGSKTNITFLGVFVLFEEMKGKCRCVGWCSCLNIYGLVYLRDKCRQIGETWEIG